ncbi:MAG: HAMP domain-containing histidine kinase [Bdellovibrionaceae bacterium]|nr:HAMP domain-containing histidine kinase [Pseudobdellovibrionaceae bacterium]
MAAPTSLNKINPQLVSYGIIAMAVILFFATVFSFVKLTNLKNKEIVEYELRIILEGNGILLKERNKRLFIEKLSINDENYFLNIQDINRAESFEAGNINVNRNGQCVSQQYFEFDIDFCRPKPLPWDFLKVITIAFLILIIMSYLVLRSLNVEMVSSFKQLFESAKISHPTDLNFSSAWGIANKMADNFQEFQNKAIALQKDRAVMDLSKQVAHDIRSPLSSLNIVLSTMQNEISIEKRELVQNSINRINDIANDLLISSKIAKDDVEVKESFSSPIKNKASGVMLTPLIEIIVAEKRTQYQNKSGVIFELDFGGENLPVVASGSDLARILSNLLNNSIESFEANHGEIKLSVRYYEDSAIISIVDNGKGIPASILQQLGTSEVTYGKGSSNHSGSGLGIFYAKERVKQWGGDLVILSKEGVGTCVQIKMSLA